MLKFTEDNICTLETDLLEYLGLPEQFVVSAMYYNISTSDLVLCYVRKLTPCANKFLTLDTYTVTVGSDHLTIIDVENSGHHCDFPDQIARYRPGYELELID